MRGKKSHFLSNRFFYLIIIPFVLAILFLLLYWWILEPIVSRYFIPKDDCIYAGLEYYHNDEYLQFEDGKAYKDMLFGFQGPHQGEVIDFVYIDNHVEDNPLRGKMCDVYAVDLHLDAEAYELEEHKVQQIAETHAHMEDFFSYAFFAPENRDYLWVISFCETSQVVRYVLITESAERDSAYGFDRCLYQHSNLEWTTVEGQE